MAQFLVSSGLYDKNETRNNTQNNLIIMKSIFKVFYMQVLEYYCYQQLLSFSHILSQASNNFIIRYLRDLLFFPHTKIKSGSVKLHKQPIYIK